MGEPTNVPAGGAIGKRRWIPCRNGGEGGLVVSSPTEPTRPPSLSPRPPGPSVVRTPALPLTDHAALRSGIRAPCLSFPICQMGTGVRGSCCQYLPAALVAGGAPQGPPSRPHVPTSPPTSGLGSPLCARRAAPAPATYSWGTATASLDLKKELFWPLAFGLCPLTSRGEQEAAGKRCPQPRAEGPRLGASPGWVGAGSGRWHPSRVANGRKSVTEGASRWHGDFRLCCRVVQRGRAGGGHLPSPPPRPSRPRREVGLRAGRPLA